MSETGLAAFDTTVQKTHAWLNAVMQELGTQDRHQAYIALRATLHALRDRMPVDEAVQLGAQLPMLVRGFYYEGWRPTATPTRERTKAGFFSHVEEHLGLTGPFAFETESLVRAIFSVIARKITGGELADVKHALPAEVRELWPAR